MSCNTKTSLAAVIDAVNAQLNNNYVDRDDPRINQGVFTEPTIRGGLMLDEAAKLDFCGFVHECGLEAPFGKQWVQRPLYPDAVLVSYDDAGEVKTKWDPIQDVVPAITGVVLHRDTMAQVLTAVELSAGDVVKTKGYHEVGDAGASMYVISADATEYSIPLANNLHAVFNDTFDIRKFGIRDNATLDQTDEITRMVKYADTREYEIDFLNYKLMTPKMWTLVRTRGVFKDTTIPNSNYPSEVMGMGFNYVHKLKNLTITHDKTQRLNTAQHLIVFAPKEYPENEVWFQLDNVTFDPWVDNYQPFTEDYLGNYDGLRCGFYVHPAEGSEINNWDTEVSNISFRLTNIHFASAAYSYNMTTSAVFANKVIAKNMTGEYLGLYLNYHAIDLDVDNVHGTFMSDLKESGRALVTNLIHYEAELWGKPAVVFDKVKVNNISAYHKQGEVLTPWTAYKYHNIGTTRVKLAEFSNVYGQICFEHCTVDKWVVKDCQQGVSILPRGLENAVDIIIDNCVLVGINGSYGSAAYLLSTPQINLLDISNSVVKYPLGIQAVTTPSSIGKMNLTNITKETPGSGHGIVRGSAFTFDEINIKDMKVVGDSTVLWVKVNTVNIDGLDIPYNSDFPTLTDVIFNTASMAATATLDVNNLKVGRTSQASYTNMFSNFNTVTVRNSYVPFRVTATGVTTRTETNVVPIQLGSKTYDFPLLAAGLVQSTTVQLLGARAGDIVAVSFSSPLLGTRLWAEATANNTVTVYQHNPTDADVDVDSGTLKVKFV